VKLIEATGDTITFHLEKREKLLLEELIKLYPVISKSYFKTAKGRAATPDGIDPVILEEALAHQQAENRRELDKMLGEAGRFQETENGHLLRLSFHQAEWLLQVLNDVRVGSWLRLGSPDLQAMELVELNEKTTPHYWAMEVCGLFESCLLQALRGRG
jgi:hypothetical protein